MTSLGTTITIERVLRHVTHHTTLDFKDLSQRKLIFPLDFIGKTGSISRSMETQDDLLNRILTTLQSVQNGYNQLAVDVQRIEGRLEAITTQQGLQLVRIFVPTLP